MYRAKHVPQKDGGVNQYNNCRMAVGCTQLDFHTRGAKTDTGSRMRLHQSDQQGGTDADDLRRAWAAGYGEILIIRNGRYWADLLAERSRGRFVGIDVWYADIPDRCQTAASFGHTMGVAPETDSRGWWLVSDPLCASYKWMDPAVIRKAMESWGRRVIGANIPHPPIYFTTSKPHEEGSNMETINVEGSGLDPDKLATMRAGSAWYHDMECTKEGNTFSVATKLGFVGATREATRAAIVKTGQPYEDKVARATIVYVRTADITKIEAVPPTPTPPGDCSAAIAARDAEWISHLTPPTT